MANAEHFRGDPAPLATGADAPGSLMQTREEERPNQDGEPPFFPSYSTFGVFRLEAMAVMLEVRRLDSMHASEHEDA